MFNKSPKSFFKALDGHSGFAAINIAPDGRIKHLSASLKKMLAPEGKLPERLTITDILQPDQWTELQKILLQRQDEHILLPLTLQYHSQEPIQLHLCALRMEGKGKTTQIALWGLIHSKSERGETDQTFSGPHAFLSMSNDSFFDATLSHEIRTPVASIVNLTQLLVESCECQEQSNILKMIQLAAEQLKSLLRDVMDISRTDAGKNPILAETFSLKPSLELLVQQYQLQTPHLSFTLNYGDTLPENLYGDKNRLLQILTNLLNNAVKFTEEGEIGLEVRDGKNARDVVFVVRDTGCGMSQEAQKRLFLPFEQGRQGASYGGSGLGLYISKRFVELQGGTIRVQSRIDEGTEIEVSLPFIPIPGTAPLAKEEKETPSVQQSKAATIAEHPILIVDDNHVNILVVRKFLEQWGYEVQQATSGKEALEKIKEQSYSLVFMDLRMPEMTGYQCAQEIRKLAPPASEIPIIALTASTEHGVKDRIKEAGMDTYIFKPFEVEWLKKLVAKYAGLPQKPAV